MTTVTQQTIDRVLVATINHAPVNALNQAARQGLKDALEAFENDRSLVALVITGSERFFSAGADITEFTRPAQPPSIASLIETIEHCDRPVIAAISGRALGGGLELALGCHLRVGTASSRYALPESKLGLLPAVGGTQRLPRLIGPVEALKAICSGEEIPAKRALELGLIDQIAQGELIPAAVALGKSSQTVPSRANAPITLSAQEREAFDQEAARLLKRHRGQEAIEACVQAVRAAIDGPLEAGLALERELFAKLQEGAQSQAMRHVFFAERRVGKLPAGTQADFEPAATVAIVGGGMMGRGIAMSLLDAGLNVTLIDVDETAAGKAVQGVAGQYQRAIDKGTLTEEEKTARMQRLTTAVDISAVAQADVVIEAVFESMAVKKDIFQQLGRHARPGAVLASNTSTLDLNEIAAASGRPADVVGMHFFSPAHIMRLVEVIRGEKTSLSTLAQALDLTRRMKKIGVVVGVCDGFVGNRMIGKRSQQVDRLLLDGALPRQIDDALTRFGFPMGPLAVNDMAGLDVAQNVRQSRGQVFPVADAICALGRYGQKTQAGYYRYEPGSRKPVDDPEITALIEKVSEQQGVQRRELSEEEILDRTLLPVINEGFRLLEEGMACHADDIDVTLIHGYGWPRSTGGPMFYAEQMGLKTLCAKMEKLATELGDPAFEPAHLLRALADEGLSVHALSRRDLPA